MTTLRFLGCKGGQFSKRTEHFQADSSLLIDGDVRILVNCGEDWVDKVDLINPDFIILTSPAPIHSYGIMKSNKSIIVGSTRTHKVLSNLFGYDEDYSILLNKSKLFGSVRVTPIGKSIMFEIDGKNVFFAPEFHTEDDVEALKQADIFIGNGISLTNNSIIKSTWGESRHVSLINQVSLCEKYGVPTAIFTSFGEECVKAGKDAIYKKLWRDVRPLSVDVTLAHHGYTHEVDAQEETLSVKQAFGSPGGKRFMLKALMKYIPKHQTYVESFVGGGSLFFKKGQSAKEVICDRDPEIYFLYKYLQLCSDSDIELLNRFNWKSNKTLFERLKAEEKVFVEKSNFSFPSEDKNTGKITPGQNESSSKRFYRLMYLKRFSDVGFMNSWNKPTDGKVHTICKRIPAIRERLSNVIIEFDSYANVIPKYDSPDTFHFIDPPYPNAQYPWKYQIRPEELHVVLKAIKGKFLLTYEVQGRSVFKGFYQKLIQLRSQANPWRGVINKTELLVANYPFDPRSKIKE